MFEKPSEQKNNSTIGNRKVEYLVEDIEKELSEIRVKALNEGKLFYKKDGSFDYAIAPNGERSRLEERQWLQTRTEHFKDWFGDWENNPSESSQVINENGEPLILYHGTTRDFSAFNHQAPKNYEQVGNTKGVLYLTQDKELAKREYGGLKLNLLNSLLSNIGDRLLGFDWDTKIKEGEKSLNNAYGACVDKWNELVRSIGTQRVNFKKQKLYGSTVVEFDNQGFILTDEAIVLWDNNIPSSFKEEDYLYEEVEGTGKQALIPKGSKPIVMELFVNSKNPILKEAKTQEFKGQNILADLDTDLGEGLYERKKLEAQGSFPDSIAIEFGASKFFCVGVFNPNQLKSAKANNGSFNQSSDNIYE